MVVVVTGDVFVPDVVVVTGVVVDEVVDPDVVVDEVVDPDVVVDGVVDPDVVVDVEVGGLVVEEVLVDDVVVVVVDVVVDGFVCLVFEVVVVGVVVDDVGGSSPRGDGARHAGRSCGHHAAAHTRPSPEAEASGVAPCSATTVNTAPAVSTPI
ncbi:hypothetical protein V1227_32015 [Lentzea sp. DG1S-22]|uniref:hypothetical protein n=1 Tax=Lentzea sp. DG1S-22 TaxID=3108822 RepID=UPI002E75A809|nr:hypothetical protein [Lentzea sp. DG1S-22]WVH79614.1 hypothetical protein V1227_32015 [Lentzea sp. DG1S-22]